MRFLFTLFLFVSTAGFSQQQMFDICPLKVGQEVPEAKLISIDGKMVDLKEVTNGKKTVLVFFRGGWCPYCIRHLSALQEIKEDIDMLGYQIVGITPDAFDSLATSSARSESDFELYSDSKIDAISAFGLGWEIDDANYVKYRDGYKMDTEKWTGEKHHVLPVPAIYVISENTIQYNYVNPNYSVRLKPETLKAVLETLD